MRLGIISGTEDGGAHSDHGAAAADCVRIIAGHTHGQNVDTYIIVFFCRYVNRKVANFQKKFVVIPRIFANRGDCHQSFDPNIGKIRHFFYQRQNIGDTKAALAFFFSDVDLQ